MKTFWSMLLFCVVILTSLLPLMANSQSLDEIVVWGDR